MVRSRKPRRAIRRFLFKPMALALTLLMMPHDLPFFGNLSLVPAAQAQTTPKNCASVGGSAIIRFVCQGSPSDALPSPPGSTLVNAIKQFENDTINMYMAAHNIPNNDPALNAFFYTYARSDLRTDIRAFMQMRLMDIAITKPVASRTANETAIYNWVQERVWSHEKHMYQAAVNDRNSWQNDRCGWQPDQDVAEMFAIHYLACVGTLTYGTAPTKDYFLRAAHKNEYDAVLANTIGALDLFWQANGKLIATLGLAPATSIAAGLASFGLMHIPKVIEAIYPGAIRGALRRIVSAANKIVLDIADKAGEDLLIRGASEAQVLLAEEEVSNAVAPGFGIVIGLAIFVIQEVVELVVEEAIAEQELKELDTLNATAQSTPPDLAQFLKDSDGQYKINVAWAETWSPEVINATTLPTPGPGDPVLLVTAMGSKVPQVATGVFYPSPTGTIWNPNLLGGWFEQTGVNPSDIAHPITQLTPTIQFIGWNQVEYTASRIGQYFAIAKAAPDPTDDVCTVPQLDPDVSNYSPTDTCASYVAGAIRMVNSQGAPVSLSIGVPPVFTSGNLAVFSSLSGTDVIPVCFPLAATGIPAPQIALFSGSLPSGITLGSCANSQALVVNHPTPGRYPVVLQATNAAGSVQQNLIVIVGDGGTQLAFPDYSLLGPGNSGGNWTLGVPTSYTWHVTGGPGPIHITTNYTWPVGLTFHDNGDGSATLSGTPTAQSPQLLCPGDSGCMLTATNGFSTATTQFGYVLNNPPAAALTGPNSYLFPANIPRSITVRTTPVITPVTIDASCGLPTWATLHDNGDGSATISGTAPYQGLSLIPNQLHLSVTTFPLAHEPAAACSTPNFSIVSDGTPVFTSPSTASNFVVGFGHSFAITTNLPSGHANITLNSPLPAGLQFVQNPDGTANIQGIPQVGTGRDYSLNLVATDPPLTTPRATQTLVLQIGEPPNFALPQTVYFNAGMPNTFFVKPTGYPKYQAMSIFLDNSPLPAGVAFTNATPVTDLAGVGVLGGTPDPSTIGMSYSLRIVASNSQGGVTRNTILKVVQPATSIGGSFSTLKTGPQNARVWTVNIANNGPGVADAAKVTAFTVVQTSAGTPCTPKVKSDLPAVAGDIPPQTTLGTPVTIDFTGCAAGAYFKVTAGISANNGAATGTITRLNQFQ